jgi:hypothetical protein
MKHILILYQEIEEVAKWLQGEAQGGGKKPTLNIELSTEGDAALDQVYALVCLGYHDEPNAAAWTRSAKTAIQQGIPVIWAVDGLELEGTFRSFTDFNTQLENSNTLFQAILDLPEPPEEKEERKTRSIRLVIPEKVKEIAADVKTEITQRIQEPDQKKEEKPRNTGKRAGQKAETSAKKHQEEKGSKDHQDNITQSSGRHHLPHVIAVGGPAGCGSSFVAWNLAVALDAVLIEGNQTGSLATWLKIKNPSSRSGFLVENLDTKWAVTAGGPFSAAEWKGIEQKSKTLVVDVGNQQGDLWKWAGKRVYVLTPDPIFQEDRYPENTLHVLNRYPEAFPSLPDQIFRSQIDLVIPDLGREAFISLWSGVPWISRQSIDIIKEWKTLVGIQEEEVAEWKNVSTWS